jgi:membrane protein
MAWTTSDRMMDLRARHPSIEVGVDTLDGWRRHISGRNASVLAFFGFLSIFPLMLAATTILGLVLKNDQELQQRIIDGALADIPVIGQQLQNDPASLSGSVWVLLAGLATALWSATKAFVALQGALDDVWEVEVDHRDAMPKQRGKALLGLALIGGAQIAGLGITAAVNEADLPLGGRLVLFAGTVVINVAVVATMYLHLTAAQPSLADVWPGSITAGIAAALIQHFGTMIVVRITTNASDTYGQFAVVLGLVTWLSLLAIATIMSAEFNAALVRFREGSLARVQPADAQP